MVGAVFSFCRVKKGGGWHIRMLKAELDKCLYFTPVHAE